MLIMIIIIKNKNRRAIKSNMNTYQYMSKEWGKRKRKNRNLNIISQFITNYLRQYTFACAEEDKYAFYHFNIVIIIMIII